MPTGRRGRGGRIAGAVRGRGAVAQHAGPAPVVADDTSECGLCSLQVGEDAVGCDDCPLWFHSTPQCMGISEASIAAIISEGDGGGLKYVCTKCRVERQPVVGGGWDNAVLDKAALSQPFMTVRNLAASVGSLVQQMTSLAGAYIQGVLGVCRTTSASETCMIVINKFNSKWETIVFLLFLVLL